eukprot:TRINITY_DN947_c0_g2_i1.p2 TRINITY_DN947_c0_g2~~TRINITY_DN947_c0_g2_i1.p2  ORF type:complete len:317 (-),score=25.43 TRINITY_DN947_c0_g2_i1:821-1771(-)
MEANRKLYRKKVNIASQDCRSILLWEAIDSSHLYQSPLFSLTGMFFFRLAMFLYFWVVILSDALGTQDALGPPFDWLKYYTNWTFVVFGTYSFVGCVICLQRLRYISRYHEVEDREYGAEVDNLHVQAVNGSDQDFSQNVQVSCHKSCNLCERIFVVLGAIALPCSLFLTVFFWAFLSDGQFDFVNFMYHGINVFLLTLDLMLIRRPMATCHVLLPMVYSALYVVFMWGFALTTSHWIYGILNWNYSTGVVMSIFLPFFVMAAYFVVYIAACLRERIFFKQKTYFPFQVELAQSRLAYIQQQNQGREVHEVHEVHV